MNALMHFFLSRKEVDYIPQLHDGDYKSSINVCVH